LKFASLQGATAQEYLPKEWTESLPSLVFWDHGRVYTESSAVVHILMKLGGLYALAAFLLLIPAQIRNRVYRWVARNRYRWFGKRELCRLPTQEERSRFLA
jgi:predicted DCC family thiol-disulfide oxidoreductase YuxK